MNQQELYMALYHRLSSDISLTQIQCERIIIELVEIMRGQLSQRKEVKLKGFGTLQVRRHKARNYRNPQNGKTIRRPAKNIVKFKQSEFWDLQYVGQHAKK